MRLWLPIVLLATLASPVLAAPDLVLVPGQKARGRIAFPGEEDHIRIDLLRGEEMSLKVKGKDGLRLGVRLLDPTGAEMSIAPLLEVKKSGESVKGKRIVATSTGSHRLVLAGLDGTTGRYKLKVKSDPVTRAKDTATAPPDREYGFAARAGTTLKIKIKRRDGDLALTATLRGPDGEVVPLPEMVIEEKKLSLNEKTLALPGDYILTVSAAPGTSGEYKAKIKLKMPRGPRGTLDFEGSSGGGDGGTPTALTLFVAATDLDHLGDTRVVIVAADFPDGHRREVTGDATLHSSHPALIAPTAPAGTIEALAPGAAVVRATYRTVASRGTVFTAGGVTLSGVEITRTTPRVGAGDTLRLFARARFSDGSSRDATDSAVWRNAAPDRLDLVRRGTFRARTAGSAAISAIVNDEEAGDATVGVDASRPVAVVVSPAYAALSTSGTRTMTATARHADGSERDVTDEATWRSDTRAAATVSAAGIVSGVADGTARIHATLEGLSSRPALVRVGGVTLASLVSAKGAIALAKGASTDLGLIAIFSDGTTGDVTASAAWVPADVDVAGASGATLTGLVTGATTVTTTLDGRVAAATVSVGPAEIVAVRILPDRVGVTVSGMESLTGAADWSDGSVSDVTASATWTSAHASVLSLGSGSVRGVSTGVGAVFARVNGITSAPALVHVGEATLSSPAVALVGSDPRLGETATFAVTARDPTSATLVLTDRAALDFDPTRLFPAGVGRLGSRRSGAANVSASFGTLTVDAIAVVVAAAERTDLALTPGSLTLPFGTEGSFTARAARTDGAVEDRTADATWTSTDESVATVSAGSVRPVSWGTTIVRATDGALTSAGRTVSVNAPTSPTVTSVSPSAVEGGNSDVSLTVTGTGFRDDLTLTASFSGSGVDVLSVAYVTPTALTVVIDVAAAAAQTSRDLTITMSSPSASVGGTGTAVLSIGSAPIVASVSPDSSGRGVTDLEVTITGDNFASGASVSFSGTGVDVEGTTFVSATKIEVAIDVAYGAAATARDVTVTNPPGSGGKSGSKTGAFRVVPPDPIVVRASPSAGLQGASNLVVTIWGANFESGSSVSFSGSGITVNSTTYRDSGKLEATISISGSAAVGARDVTVTLPSAQGSGSMVATGLFTVLSDTPTVTGLTPGKIPAGASAVPVIVTGTSFATGAILTVSGSGVTASDVTVVDDATITARLTVTGGASTGTRDVTVKNAAAVGGKSGTGSGLLEVLTSTAIAVYSVSPDEGPGDGGTRMTVRGANFPVAAAVSFGSNLGHGVLRVDSGTLLVTTPRATSVSKTTATRVDVKVDSGSTSGTLAKGFAYRADAVAPTVLGTSPPNRIIATATPDVPLNLVRVTFRMSEPVLSSTVVRSNFTLARKRPADGSYITQSGGSVALGPDGRTVTFTVPASLAVSGAEFFVSMKNTVTDTAGNALDATPFTGSIYQTQCRLSSSSDWTAPTVSSVSPSHLATGVDADDTVVVTFSEEVDPVTSAAAFRLKQGSTSIPGHVAIDAALKVLTFTPNGLLEAGKVYSVGVSTTLRDRSDNALASAHASTFTVATSDGTVPVVDVITFDDIRSDMNGSTTYKDSGGIDRSFRLDLPPDGFAIRIEYSDLGGSGVDVSSLVVKCSKDLGTGAGKIAANTDLASSFTAGLGGATFAVSADRAVATGSGAVFTVTVKDKTGNTSVSKTITVDVTSRTAVLDPFDSRQVWLLRFDHDEFRLTATADGFVGGGSKKEDTRIKIVSVQSASDPAKADLLEDLEILGLRSNESGQGAKTVTNGGRTGANAIVVHLLTQRIRARVRERFEIDADGTRDGGSVNIEFLLPGERGSLSSPPDPASWSGTGTFSMFGIGGDGKANSGYASGPLGRASYDARNTSQENDVPSGNPSGELGMFLTHLIRFNVNSSSDFRERFDPFIPLRNTGSTAVGQSDLDAVILAGAFDRGSNSNTSAQNDRYDAITNAIETLALSISSTVAHEIGHSTGLVANGAPPKGLFGDADTRNTFAGSGTDSNHLDTPGPNLMASSSTFGDSLETGEDAERFGEMMLAWLRRHLLYDETK